MNWTMALAAEGGHVAIVRLCHDEWHASNVNWAMEVLHAMARKLSCGCAWGATNVNLAMAVATKEGHEAIVRLCHNVRHAADVDKAMARAPYYGHESIVRLCRGALLK